MLHNNPVEIADQERTALWPDVHYPDIMLSLGAGRSSLGKDLPVRQLIRSKTGIITYARHLIELLKMNMDTTLNCDEAWHKYERVVKSVAGHFNPPIPMFRISPILPGLLPSLDDTSAVEALNDLTSRALEEDFTITKVASQLIASAFYFDPESSKDGHGDKFRIKGASKSLSSLSSIQGSLIVRI